MTPKKKPPEGIPHITCEHLLKLHGKTDKEHVVLDVRDRGEFEAGHIKDSLNIPRRELATNIENLIPDKGRKVVVIVGPTLEPEIEAIHATLKDMGYANAEFLAGGFDEWCELAPLEIEPDLLEQTPEEAGFTGHALEEPEEGDPDHQDDEPLM